MTEWQCMSRTGHKALTTAQLVQSDQGYSVSLFAQAPSYLQSGWQWSPTRAHLQFPLQETTQPQWRRSEHALLTSSSSVQYGIHRLFLLLHSQPHSLYFGVTGVWAIDCFQTNAAVSKVRLACARDVVCDVSQCWGWLGFVWWRWECPWYPKKFTPCTILFVFLIETVQTQCHNQWTHGRGGGAMLNT